MEGGPSDYALVEGEAENVAREAVKALKESRKHYRLTFEQSNAGTAPNMPKPRFGIKKFGNRLNANNSSDNQENKDKVCFIFYLK